MHGEIVHRRGTKALRQRFASMAGHLSQSDGLDAALAIHLGLYCMAAGCFALGLFLLLLALMRRLGVSTALALALGTVFVAAPAFVL